LPFVSDFLEIKAFLIAVVIKERVEERKWVMKGEIRRSVVFVVRWLITLDILTPDDISKFLQGEIPEETDSEPEQTWDYRPRPYTALAAT
jgi:hypothetical protein